LKKLIGEKQLDAIGVAYDPYSTMEVSCTILAIIQDSKSQPVAKSSERVEIIIPKSCFYIESGGRLLIQALSKARTG